MAAADRHQRVLELRAAHRARRLIVEREPRVRSTRRSPAAIAIDANAAASAMVTTFAQRGWRLA
jgi:hypothetical protein